MTTYMTCILYSLINLCSLKFYETTVIENVQFSQMIETGPDVFISEIYLDLSASECKDKCELKQNCEYFNYATSSHYCALISLENENAQVVSITHTGYIYGSKKQWLTTTHNSCDRCTYNETCVLDPTGSCRITGCGKPKPSSNVVVLGNMFKVGDHVVYFTEGTSSVTMETGRSTCDSDGMWIDSNVQIHCPANMLQFHKSCFYFETKKLEWMAAKENCESKNARLADITSDEERDILVYHDRHTFKNVDRLLVYHIGLSDLDVEGDFRWTDGSTLTYLIWDRNNPDNKDEEDCGQFWIRANTGQFNDGKCGDRLWSICEAGLI